MRSTMRSLKRCALVLTITAFVAVVVAMPGGAAPPSPYSTDNPLKINVMGEWAHPDDDTSIIGPCGVWHQQFGTRCGVNVTATSAPSARSSWSISGAWRWVPTP